MKNHSQQLNLFPNTPPLRSSPLKGTFRTRDSCGRYATEIQVAEKKIDFLRNQNEMLTRKYLAVTNQLNTIQRELHKLKNSEK